MVTNGGPWIRYSCCKFASPVGYVVQVLHCMASVTILFVRLLLLSCWPFWDLAWQGTNPSPFRKGSNGWDGDENYALFNEKMRVPAERHLAMGFWSGGIRQLRLDFWPPHTHSRSTLYMYKVFQHLQQWLVVIRMSPQADIYLSPHSAGAVGESLGFSLVWAAEIDIHTSYS